MRFLLILPLAVLVFLSGCASSGKRAVIPWNNTKSLWLVSNGFHSGVVIRTSDAGPKLRALAPDPKARWILIGWGNQRFFLVRKTDLFSVVRAAVPTKSALHIVPMQKPPQVMFPRSNVYEFHVEPDGIDAARDYVERSFAWDTSGKPVGLGDGYFPGSKFYNGREMFWFPKTCNVWSATVLERAGVLEAPRLAITAQQLEWQAVRAGRQIGKRQKPSDGF